MSDLATLLQQYGYGGQPNALAQDAPTVDTSNVLAWMPPRNGALSDALHVAGVPQDEHGFLFSNVGGELKFNPWEAIKNFMSYRAPPGALSTSGDDAPVRNATDAASWLGLSGLGLNFTGQVPKNALGMFGGRLAKTADHAALAKAEEMAAKGFSRNDIRQETGWFKDAGGNWRFEIPDHTASISDGTGKLANVLSHDALFEAYPQLRALLVGKLGPESPGVGSYLPRAQGVVGGIMERLMGPSARIDVAPDATRGTFLHEAQHAVDDIEGMFANVDRKNPYDATGYRDAPFEQSARAVQARADLTPAERQERAPWFDYVVSARVSRPAHSTPTSAPESVGIPLLPERAALDEAFRGIGMEPKKSMIEAMKGKWNQRNSTGGFDKTLQLLLDSSLGRGVGFDSKISKDPKWQAWGRSVEAYRNKAQQIGHNGGPEPSTWEDPFIYALRKGE